MFKVVDKIVVYGQHNKILMMQDPGGGWHIDRIDKTLPLEVATTVFKFWYKHNSYLNGCSPETVVEELTRVKDGGLLFIGDRIILADGTHEVFDDQQNADRPTVDLSLGTLHRVFLIKPYIVPKYAESIDRVTVRYDPCTRSLRVYVRGNYLGRIPLLC